MNPQLRRFAEVLPPAVLAAAALALAHGASRDEIDVALLQFAVLLALFECVSCLVEAPLAMWRTEDPRAGRAIGFIAASAALIGGAAVLARAWPGSVVAALVPAVLLVATRFAVRAADPARDELARLRATALANDRFDSVQVALGVLPFLAVPWLAAALAGWITSLRPVNVVAFLLPAGWAALLAAAAWHACSRGFATRAQRLYVRGWWPRLAYWYVSPSLQRHARAERKSELQAARRFARRAAAGDTRAARLERPPRRR